MEVQELQLCMKATGASARLRAKDPGPQTRLGGCVTRCRDKGQEQHL